MPDYRPTKERVSGIVAQPLFSLGETVYLVSGHCYLIEGNPTYEEDPKQWKADLNAGKQFVSPPIQITGMFLGGPSRSEIYYQFPGRGNNLACDLFRDPAKAQAAADVRNKVNGIPY